LELDALSIRWNIRIPSELLADLCRECVCRGWFAVGDECALRRAPEPTEPRQDLLAVGMGGHAREIADFRTNDDVFAVNAEYPPALLQHATACSSGLVADEQDRVSRISAEGFYVMEHAPAGQHSACR
jgi:hypothetical protein